MNLVDADAGTKDALGQAFYVDVPSDQAVPEPFTAGEALAKQFYAVICVQTHMTA